MCLLGQEVSQHMAEGRQPTLQVRAATGQEQDGART